MAETPRVVVSLSTIPSRIRHIQPSLQSILAQTRAPDAIYLCVPDLSRRENLPYAIPDFISDDSRVTILRGEDYGPATKLIPALLMERDGDTIHITVDDDNLYEAELVANLVSRIMAAPGKSFGMNGLRLRRRYADIRFEEVVEKDRVVDILQGFAGVAYRRSFFGEGFLPFFREIEHCAACVAADDLVFSAWLEIHDIGRIQAGRGNKPEQVPEIHERNALSHDGMPGKYEDCMRFLSARFGIWRHLD